MRAVELFAGAGGLGIGISMVGFKPLAVVEIDRFCCETIRENQANNLPFVRDWPLLQSDVREFPFSSLEGEVDLVSGGPPCQPFSIGGKSLGMPDSRDMFPQAVRAVREIRPRAFIFENVKGLTRSAFNSYFEYVRLQLTYPDLTQKCGETWQDHFLNLERHHTSGKESGLHYRLLTRVLNAADFGVPQKRERVFFVGFRADQNSDWSFPEPTHSREALLWDQFVSLEYWVRHRVRVKSEILTDAIESRIARLSESPNSKPWVTIRDAISDLPDPTDAQTNNLLNHQYQHGARQYVGHTGSPMDEPAKTLKAGSHGVPGGENMLLRPDGTVRYFTVRESARLQTFPDNFVFHGSWSENMRQLGNAVPVKLATVIAQSVYKRLGDY